MKLGKSWGLGREAGRRNRKQALSANRRLEKRNRTKEKRNRTREKRARQEKLELEN